MQLYMNEMHKSIINRLNMHDEQYSLFPGSICAMNEDELK